jgi:hypothetical protein
VRGVKASPILWIAGLTAVLFIAGELAKPPSAVDPSAIAPSYAPTTFESFDANAVDGSEDTSSAVETAAEAVAETTYQDQGTPYGCTQDCSGHDAGYEWAKDHDVTDAGDCGGDSQSFVEGCEAYAEAYEQALSEAKQSEDGEQ